MPRLILLPAVAGVCLILSVTAATVVAQQTPWIKVERGPGYEVLDDRDSVTVPIPVSLRAGTNPQSVSFKQIDVRFEKRFEEGLANAFKVPEKLNINTQRGPTIDLTIDLKRASAPGSYFLLVEAAKAGGTTTTGQAGQPTTQLLEIQIIHSAAKLKPVGTLVIEQTLIPFMSPRITSPPLQLKETSKVSRLTGLTIRPLDFFGSADQIANGSIEFTNMDSNSSIAPGAGINASFQLKGEFPLGTSKGAAEVNARQLTDSFPINFEVRTRRTPFLIFVIAAFGLLLGFVCRTVLQTQVLLNEARLKAMDVEDTLTRELLRPDETFRQQVRPALNALIAARNGRDITAINNALTHASETLTNQLKLLATRQAEAEGLFEELSGVLAIPWSLPAPITEVLTNLRGRLQQARVNLDRGAVDVSFDSLNGISGDLINQMTEPVSDFRVWLTNIDLLGSPDVRLPASVARLLTQAIERMKPLLQKVTIVGANTTRTQLKEILQAIHDVHVNTRELLLQLARWLEDALSMVKAELDKASLSGSKPVQDLEGAVSALVQEIRSGAGNAEETLRILSAERLSKLDASWRNAVESQMVNFSEAEKKPITELLDKREYAQAASVLEKVIRAKNSAEGSRMGGTTTIFSAMDVAVAAAWSPLLESLGTPSETVIHWFGGAEGRLLPTLTRAQTIRQLMSAKFLQFLIFGLGILIVGYLLFAPKFVGTFPDMAGVFLWAFGLDVTIDAFAGAVKNARST